MGRHDAVKKSHKTPHGRGVKRDFEGEEPFFSKKGVPSPKSAQALTKKQKGYERNGREEAAKKE